MSKSLVHQPTQGEHLSVVGEHIRILVDSQATGGKCVIFENISPVGNGPPLHRHSRDDEFFFVIEGTVKFSVDGKETTLTAGGSVFAPRGSVHAFVNAGKTPSRIITACFPGGLEVPFRECDQLARQGKESPETVTAAFKKFDLEILGPPLNSD